MKITFETASFSLDYVRRTKYLDHVKDNSILFIELGIVDEKFELAKEAYGYEADPGHWPEYRPNDWEALDRFLKLISDRFGVNVYKDNVLFSKGNPLSLDPIFSL